MKIKFISDDDYPELRTHERYYMRIVLRSALHEGKKYYTQVFLDEYLYKS